MLAALTALPAFGAQTASGQLDWVSYNRDLASDRFSTLLRISKTTVAKLHVVCTAQLGRFPRFETGPIEVRGVLFVTTANKTFALDAAKCTTRWEKT